MKEFFIASICRNGILGGGITADEEGLTYRTGKLTVPTELRNLELKYRNMRGWSEKRIFCFPLFSIDMTDGETYQFIIFSPKRFSSLLREKVQSDGTL